jgi:hypothetical protein
MRINDDLTVRGMTEQEMDRIRNNAVMTKLLSWFTVFKWP